LKFQQKAPVGFSTGLSTGRFCDIYHFTQRCDFSHKNIFSKCPICYDFRFENVRPKW